MSNTDGEDKIESLTLENERLKQAHKYIHASRNNVDKELNEAYQELASLREQLERAKYALSIMEGNRDRLFDQLKQKEDENRELWKALEALSPTVKK